MSEKIWTCKIGSVDDTDLPDGADLQMRQAAQIAYLALTGREAGFTFSGWGGKLDDTELEAISAKATP